MIDGYALDEDRFWRPARMEMVNHLNGKSTVMTWSDYRFATGLGEQGFTTRALERTR